MSHLPPLKGAFQDGNLNSDGESSGEKGKAVSRFNFGMLSDPESPDSSSRKDPDLRGELSGKLFTPSNSIRLPIISSYPSPEDSFGQESPRSGRRHSTTAIWSGIKYPVPAEGYPLFDGPLPRRHTLNEVDLVPSPSTSVVSSPASTSHPEHSNFSVVSPDILTLDLKSARRTPRTPTLDSIRDQEPDSVSSTPRELFSPRLPQQTKSPPNMPLLPIALHKSSLGSPASQSSITFTSRSTSRKHLTEGTSAASAKASRDGVLIEWNDAFQQACGLTTGTSYNILSLAKFESPEATMLASEELYSLTGDKLWIALLDNHLNNCNIVVNFVADSSVPVRNVKRVSGYLSVNLKSRTSGSTESYVLTSNVDDSRVCGPADVLSVLVIDDSDAVRRKVTRCLEADGHSVIAVSSPKVGLSLLQDGTSRFDLVIVEINIPELSGLELCHKFREFENMKQGSGGTSASSESAVESEENRQIIIAFTADFTATVVHESMAAGFDAFLCKPFTLKKFKEVVDGLIG